MYQVLLVRYHGNFTLWLYKQHPQQKAIHPVVKAPPFLKRICMNAQTMSRALKTKTAVPQTRKNPRPSFDDRGF